MIKIGNYYIDISDIDYCKIDDSNKISIKFKHSTELFFSATDSEKNNLKRALETEVRYYKSTHY